MANLLVIWSTFGRQRSTTLAVKAIELDARVVIVKDSAWAGAHVSGIFIPSLFVLGLENFKASVNLMNIDAK